MRLWRSQTIDSYKIHFKMTAIIFQYFVSRQTCEITHNNLGETLGPLSHVIITQQRISARPYRKPWSGLAGRDSQQHTSQGQSDALPWQGVIWCWNQTRMLLRFNQTRMRIDETGHGRQEFVYIRYKSKYKKVDVLPYRWYSLTSRAFDLRGHSH